jgi:YYY domain-containing protein
VLKSADLLRLFGAPESAHNAGRGRPARRAARPLLLLFALGAAIGVAAGTGSGRTLMFGDEDHRLYELHGTWHRMFDWGFAEQAPVVVWVLALVVLGLIGLPYVWVACWSLPDRGFALARPVGLLLVGWLVWLFAGAGIVDFSRRSIAGAIGVVAAGAVVLAAPRRQTFVAWTRARWKLILVEEGIFWTLFGAAVVIRWLNPDLWHPTRGGEKPMDLAYLTAVVKSTHFPPYDPWFAGGQMNYYYFGFVLVAVLVKLTSIVPYVAYNLAVPTLFAFLGSCAFTVTLGLVGDSGGRRHRRAGLFAAGLLGTLFVAVAGNLGEIRVLVDRISGRVPIEWWYWNPTRVMHHPIGEPGPITEFPAFTYLYADLHAHAMALPYTAVLLALAIAQLRRRDRPKRADVGAVGAFLLLALVLGALWPLNTWDVPTYALLAVLALALAWYASPRPAPLAGAVTLVLRCALLIGLAYVLFLPFHRHYSGVFAGVARWHGGRTRLNDYLTIHGLFLFVIVTAILVDLATSTDLGPVARFYRTGLQSWDRIGRFRDLHRLLVRASPAYSAARLLPPAAAVLALVLVSIGDYVPALAAVLVTLTCLALFRRPRAGVNRTAQERWRFTLLLFLVGLLITVGVEFLVAKNIDVGRTNTVFKFYLQVWVLWGIAAAVSAHRLYAQPAGDRRLWQLSWRIAFIGLLAVACLYPILATRAKVGDRFDTTVGPSLSGLAFASKAVLFDHGAKIPLAPDAAAIRWLQANVRGSPVVAEVNTYPTLYGWGDRYAMFTGNPTIVGWDYHQRQQRPPQAELVRQRIADVQTAYGTTDPAMAARIFRRYGVSYFVVGPLERAYFPDGQAKWMRGVGRYWHPAYSSPDVQIYELD